MFTRRCWHVCMTDMSGPGPALRWMFWSMVAIVGFGLVALGLLNAGCSCGSVRGCWILATRKRALASARRPRSIQPHCGR